MLELLVSNPWVIGILIVAAVIAGIAQYFKGSNELWKMLSQRFGISTKDWPDEFPDESAVCKLEALEEELIGWIFVRKNGLMFRLPRLRKKDNALLFPWEEIRGFRIDSGTNSATFAVDRKVGPRVEIRISWDQKLSRMAEDYCTAMSN